VKCHRFSPTSAFWRWTYIADRGRDQVPRAVRGAAEDHHEGVMESQNSIVFIDELHTLVARGSAEGSLDARIF